MNTRKSKQAKASKKSIEAPSFLECVLHANVFIHFHEFLSISSLASLMCANHALRSLCGTQDVIAKHSTEWIQAGDEILHLSSHFGGLQRYQCTVLEVFENRVSTTLAWKRSLSDDDRVAKAGWPFFMYLYTYCCMLMCHVLQRYQVGFA